MNTWLNIKTVLLQTIQFSISTQFSSIWPIDRTLSGATTLGQSGTGSDGNEGALLIPQRSSITEATPSECLVSYPAHIYEVTQKVLLVPSNLVPLVNFKWICLQQFINNHNLSKMT